MKPTVYIPFSELPESQRWAIDKVYRVKMVLKQTSLSQEGANFEIVDATSLEPEDKGKRVYLSEGGTIKG